VEAAAITTYFDFCLLGKNFQETPGYVAFLKSKLGKKYMIQHYFLWQRTDFRADYKSLSLVFSTYYTNV